MRSKGPRAAMALGVAIVRPAKPARPIALRARLTPSLVRMSTILTYVRFMEIANARYYFCSDVHNFNICYFCGRFCCASKAILLVCPFS